MMKAVVIGVGRMGRRHVQVVMDMGISIAGVCDQAQESLNECRKEFNLSPDQLFCDAAEMLKATKPECVIIATTSPTHCEYTCLAAELGAKFILCEKPMAVSLEQCDRMIETCKKNNATLAINHQMRFMEQYTEPKQMMQSESYGGLSSITVVAGNFGLAMNGTHYFEMFHFMTDEDPFEVTAWFSSEKVPNPRGAHFEDRAGSVRVTTRSGKRFYLEVSAEQGHGVTAIYAGRNGQVFIDELHGIMHACVRKAEDRNLPTTRYGTLSDLQEKSIQPADAISPTKSVLNALITKNNYPSGDDGRLAVATLVAAYHSHEHGHIPVTVDDPVLPLEQVFPWA
ncbi:Gfo/Idh/MocA family protein [Methanoregula sp.]|uniref:Gfo/Idh/MocA family protein n=1 Tax=Methanoregula sp. TaxID=2052170 RepID=UPI003562B3D5